MKKVIVLLLCVVLAVSLMACGKEKAEEAAVGMANPVHEATLETVLSEVGFDLSSCEPFKPTYSTIDGDPKIAQAQFTADNLNYNYRIAMAAEATDISGLYYEWAEETTAKVDYCDATVNLTKDGVGCISWFDIVPGVMYTLSMDKGATAELLTDMANQLFVPTQGDA